MTSRERIQKAIRFATPDRVPHYLPDNEPNDILWLWPDKPAPKQDWHKVGDHNIMGIQNMFLAYYEHPEDLKKLLQRFSDAQKQSIRLLAEIGCDGVMGYNDWGLQNSLMISKEMIVDFFLPHYLENWTLAKSLGLDVWLHSCGNILGILPDFIDAGLTVIQMDQQENMGLESISAVTRDRLACWCPVDIQRTMIDGTNENIKNYAGDLIKKFGSPKGGFISMAYSTPDDIDHSPEKLASMCSSFRAHEFEHQGST